MKNIVVMFPYPSGDGLHVGHAYNYAVMDSYCRFLRYDGETVLQPFGYDAFGLPAENHARKVGGDPREITYANIEKFRAQMKRMNTEYVDKLVTADPSYYKWTQWLFTKLHEAGLAYKADGEVNWCETCGTVLANEQAIPFDPQNRNGPFKCERCGFQVHKKMMNQWYFKMTAYKDRLLEGIGSVKCPESTRKMQIDWIGNLRDWCVSRQRKWGCPIPIKGETDTLDTFVDSSFYYLRYLTDSTEEFLPKGCYHPIDLYVGGPEHATMHLIYARFIHMFLYDIGIVPQPEPFNCILHQGMITRNGAKISKRSGNALNPDDFDPDVLRLHLMFIGPYEEGGNWRDDNIVGPEKFLKRMKLWLGQCSSSSAGTDIPFEPLESAVREYVDRFKFNKVVSEFMTFYNNNKNKVPNYESAEKITKLLRCFAPSFTIEGR